MAAPGIPGNFYVQQANSQVYLSWGLTAGATSYQVQRSTDGISYSVVASPTSANYLDTAVTVGTQYWYKVAATNTDGTSPYTVPQSVVPTAKADVSLGQLRLMAQQRADLVNSKYVKLPEWNSYITQSYFELYDILVSSYGEEYFIADPYVFQTTGATTFQYDLPPDFYKLMGVDLGLNSNQNAWVTLKKFDFIERNRFVYPQVTTTAYGVFNLRYRVLGDKLSFIPTPSAGQYVRVWYIPKMTQPLQDTDIIKGVSGWTEYIVIDAAIKAMQKEESDVSVLLAQKAAIIARIESMAQNRDAGEPDTISDSQRFVGRYGGFWPNGDGPSGGY